MGHHRNPTNLNQLREGPRYKFVKGNIANPSLCRRVVRNADVVVNFAAETHVDRSIAGPNPFLESNVIGTFNLLDACRTISIKKIIHISTDEVYGSIDSGSFSEESPLNPSSPYSATKAAGDLLVAAHVNTYGVHASICRGSNNYGPRQYPEKLIPLCLLNALAGDPVPV